MNETEMATGRESCAPGAGSKAGQEAGPEARLSAKPAGFSRIMLLGESHRDKSAVIGALTGEEYRPRKVQTTVYFRNFVDTPSEFLENRFFFPALITASAHCDAILFVQDATRSWCMLHPGLARMFNRKVVGVVTNCDHERANVERARRFLANTGVRDVVEARLGEEAGAELLRKALAAHGIAAG